MLLLTKLLFNDFHTSFDIWQRFQPNKKALNALLGASVQSRSPWSTSLFWRRPWSRSPCFSSTGASARISIYLFMKDWLESVSERSHVKTQLQPVTFLTFQKSLSVISMRQVFPCMSSRGHEQSLHEKYYSWPLKCPGVSENGCSIAHSVRDLPPEEEAVSLYSQRLLRYQIENLEYSYRLRGT